MLIPHNNLPRFTSLHCSTVHHRAPHRVKYSQVYKTQLTLALLPPFHSPPLIQMMRCLLLNWSTRNRPHKHLNRTYCWRNLSGSRKVFPCYGNHSPWTMNLLTNNFGMTQPPNHSLRTILATITCLPPPNLFTILEPNTHII